MRRQRQPLQGLEQQRRRRVQQHSRRQPTPRRIHPQQAPHQQHRLCLPPPALPAALAGWWTA